MSDSAARLSPALQPDRSQIALSDSASRTPVPRALLIWLTVGVAGAVLFTTTYVIEGATRPGYDGWQQAISAHSLGPGGWLQQANFVVLTVCTLCMAVAWRKVLTGGGLVALSYPIIRAIEGFAMIGVGFFSQDPVPGYPPGTLVTSPTTHGEIHIIGAYVVVGAMAAGLLVIAWHFARALHWRGLGSLFRDQWDPHPLFHGPLRNGTARRRRRSLRASGYQLRNGLGSLAACSSVGRSEIYAARRVALLPDDPRRYAADSISTPP